MTVELTPRGTYGVQMQKIPRPLRKVFFGLFFVVRRLGGARLLSLTTIGAKSGRPHSVPLRWFPAENNAWLIVASYGGAVSHPAWYVNMARNPDQVWIEVGGRRLKVRPESLNGAERQAAWQRIVSQAPGYGAYQTKTDRELPIVCLRPAP